MTALSPSRATRAPWREAGEEEEEAAAEAEAGERKDEAEEGGILSDQSQGHDVE